MRPNGPGRPVRVLTAISLGPPELRPRRMSLATVWLSVSWLSLAIATAKARRSSGMSTVVRMSQGYASSSSRCDDVRSQVDNAVSLGQLLIIARRSVERRLERSVDLPCGRGVERMGLVGRVRRPGDLAGPRPADGCVQR